MDVSTVITAGQTPCEVCAASDPDMSEFCIPQEHTETVQRLARALGMSLAGPPGHPEAHPEWYIEDAVAIVELGAQESDAWVIEHDEGWIGEFFKVNGLEFYIDPNGEGYNPPVLGAEHRAWLAEEVSWDQEER